MNKQLSELTHELRVIENANTDVLYNQSKRIVNTMVDLKELMMMYSGAMKEVRTKLEILSTEYNVRYQRNPINMRLKRLTSTMEKLERYGIWQTKRKEKSAYTSVCREASRAGESVSVENQKLMLTKHVKEMGWELKKIYPFPVLAIPIHPYMGRIKGGSMPRYIWL